MNSRVIYDNLQVGFDIDRQCKDLNLGGSVMYPRDHPITQPKGLAEEFRVAVEAIGHVRHENLVRLLEYCVKEIHSSEDISKAIPTIDANDVELPLSLHHLPSAQFLLLRPEPVPPHIGNSEPLRKLVINEEAPFGTAEIDEVLKTVLLSRSAATIYSDGCIHDAFAAFWKTGTRIKTRKQNIIAPLDPVAFADAVVQIYLDNASDLAVGDVSGGDLGSRLEERLWPRTFVTTKETVVVCDSAIVTLKGKSLQEFIYSEVSILGSGWIDGEDHPRQALLPLLLEKEDAAPEEAVAAGGAAGFGSCIHSERNTYCSR
ncbi:putative receptor-like protein kinase [Platanthera guangdongensis]|uniref:Receptor-like protein kinase n=1 Tax=Platanthera guangdongensis TaxID=2320717 RepID=A0ABR2LJK3_9ASPA